MSVRSLLVLCAAIVVLLLAGLSLLGAFVFAGTDSSPPGRARPYAVATPVLTPAPSPRPGVPPADGEAAAGPLGKLAFVRDGNVWVKALPDGRETPLVLDGDASAPRWSASGDWLLYRRQLPPGRTVPADAPRQWLVRADGSGRRQLPARATWSPASDLLAFVDSGRLMVEAADGSRRRELAAATSEAGVQGSLGQPVWSPDGVWLAYAETGAGRRFVSLQAVRADGSERRELLREEAPRDGIVVRAWTAGASWVLFARDAAFSASIRADGVSLFAVALDGGEPLDLGLRVLDHDDHLSPAPREPALAVVDGGGRETWRNKRLMLLRFEDGGVSRETIGAAGSTSLSPAWSPDGSRLAFVVGPEGDRSVVGGEAAAALTAQRRVWLAAPGSRPVRLTAFEAGREERPLWSADGRYLLFARLGPGFGDLDYSLWLLRLEDGRLTPLLASLPLGPYGSFGYYGHVDFAEVFDWWRPSAVEGR